MTDILYHYTSRYHLPKILKQGYLKLTDSNLISPKEDGYLIKPDYLLYKPVVWLTRSTDGSKSGLEGATFDKREIRITVRKRPHYDRWLLWSRQNKIKSWWAKALEHGKNPKDWYVSEQIILLNADELVKIENTVTGEIIIDVATGCNCYLVEVTKPVKMATEMYKRFMADSGLKEGDALRFVV